MSLPFGSLMSRRSFAGLLGLGTVPVMTEQGRREFRLVLSTLSTPEPESGNSEFLVNAAEIADLPGQTSLQFVALMPESSFGTAHIPGSLRFDWPDFDLAETSVQDSVRDWAAKTATNLAAAGLDFTRHIMIYDDGTLFSARLWWVLDFLGFDEKSVVNGGISAWKSAGGDVNSEKDPVAKPVPVVDADVLQWDAIALLPDVEAAGSDPDVTFLDVRGADEYRSGHIPGAINIPYTSNAAASDSGMWKSPDELMQMYSDAGIHPGKQIIPYCSTGVRSAVTWFTLRYLGFPNVSLFTGSWREWSSHPDLPVTVGDMP